MIFPIGFTQQCCSCAYKLDRKECCQGKPIRCLDCQENDTVRFIKDVAFGTIMTCKSLVRDFNFFEKKNQKTDNGKHIAICNIDGSFTNNIPMPTFSEENNMLETLWLEL